MIINFENGWLENFKDVLRKRGHKLSGRSNWKFYSTYCNKKFEFTYGRNYIYLINIYKPQQYLSHTPSFFNIDLDGLENYLKALEEKRNKLKESKNVVQFGSMFFDASIYGILKDLFPENEVIISNRLHESKFIQIQIKFNEFFLNFIFETTIAFNKLNNKNLMNSFWKIQFYHNSVKCHQTFSRVVSYTFKLNKFLKVMETDSFKELLKEFKTMLENDTKELNGLYNTEKLLDKYSKEFKNICCEFERLRYTSNNKDIFDKHFSEIIKKI